MYLGVEFLKTLMMLLSFVHSGNDFLIKVIILCFMCTQTMFVFYNTDDVVLFSVLRQRLSDNNNTILLFVSSGDGFLITLMILCSFCTQAMCFSYNNNASLLFVYPGNGFLITVMRLCFFVLRGGKLQLCALPRAVQHYK